MSKLEPMLKEYYRARGWDEQGVPKPQKLAELDLAGFTVSMEGTR